VSDVDFDVDLLSDGHSVTARYGPFTLWPVSEFLNFTLMAFSRALSFCTLRSGECDE
jgi:hypothetical protein